MHVVLNIAYIRSFLYKLDVNNTLTDFSVTFIYLTVLRAGPEDAGVYVCSAVNVAGSMNISVSLEVHGEALGALGLSVWEIGSLSVVAVVMFLMGDVLCLHR